MRVVGIYRSIDNLQQSINLELLGCTKNFVTINSHISFRQSWKLCFRSYFLPKDKNDRAKNSAGFQWRYQLCETLCHISRMYSKRRYSDFFSRQNFMNQELISIDIYTGWFVLVYIQISIKAVLVVGIKLGTFWKYRSSNIDKWTIEVIRLKIWKPD